MALRADRVLVWSANISPRYKTEEIIGRCRQRAVSQFAEATGTRALDVVSVYEMKVEGVGSCC